MDVDIIKTILNETIPEMSQLLKLVCSKWNAFILQNQKRDHIQNYCIKNDHLEVLKFMECRGNFIYFDSLYTAIYNGKRDIIEWMFSIGIKLKEDWIFESISSTDDGMFHFLKDLYREKQWLGHFGDDEKIPIFLRDRIDIVLEFTESFWDAPKLCVEAAFFGSIQILRYSLRKINNLDPCVKKHTIGKVVKKACRRGKKQVLDLLCELDYDPTDFITLILLVKGNLLDLIPKYKHGKIFWKDGIIGACILGDLELLKECVENDRDDVRNIDNFGDFYRVARKHSMINENVEVFEYLLSKGFKVNGNFVSWAASKGHKNVLEWAIKKQVPLDCDLIFSALRNEHLDIAIWGSEKGFPILNDEGGSIMRVIIQFYGESTLDWAVNRGLSINDTYLRYMSRRGQLGMIKLSQKYKPGIVEKRISEILNAAIFHGKIEVLEWLKENYSLFFDFASNIYETNNVSSLRWLYDNGYIFRLDDYIIRIIQHDYVDALLWFIKTYRIPLKKIKQIIENLHENEDTKFDSFLQIENMVERYHYWFYK